jgi:hypothetical protein
MHKGRIRAGSSAFENLPKRKQAGLKVRSVGEAIRWLMFRGKQCMGMNLRNQVVQIARRFDCRWIGQSIERCPNNQQAQQACRDLGSPGPVALCNYQSGKSVAHGHWPSQKRHPLFLGCAKLYGRKLTTRKDNMSSEMAIGPENWQLLWSLVGLGREQGKGKSQSVAHNSPSAGHRCVYAASLAGNHGCPMTLPRSARGDLRPSAIP